MDKNQYFYEYQAALNKACEEETKVRKNKVLLVQYFQAHWDAAIGRIEAAELLRKGIEEICADKPKGRKRNDSPRSQKM